MSGPLPQEDGVVRWRCINLRDQIAKRYQVGVHECTSARVRGRAVGKLLRRSDMKRLQPRPSRPKKDADAEEAFNKRAELVSNNLPPAVAGKSVEILFQTL